MDDECSVDRSWRLLTVLDRMAFPLIITALLVTVPAVLGYNTCPCGGGNVAVAKAQMKQFETAIVVYAMKFGTAPYALEDLIWPPSGTPILTSESIPLDP